MKNAHPFYTRAGKPAGGAEEEIDLKKLNAAKIKEMMKRDPKFIGRLIGVSATRHSSF